MNFDIIWQPLLSMPWLITLGFIALTLIAISLYTRQRGSILRTVALSALFITLLNPSVNQEQRRQLNDIAVLVIDQSTSQDIDNRRAQTEQARKAVEQSIANLKNTELRTIYVTSGISINDDGTRIFNALNATLQDIPPERFAGAIIISDGQIHDVPKPFKTASAPYHLLLTGNKNETDRQVEIINAPKFSIIGTQQTIRFKVNQFGKAANGNRALVTIARDGERVGQITVDTGKAIDFSATISHGGQNIFEISANIYPNELSKQNNRAVAVINGIRDRLRVLLVSGQPHPGERTWRNLLKADPSVDLVHFTILRPPEKQDGTPINELSLIAFPTRELFSEKLHEFDLVIFDRYARRGVLPGIYLYNIADYVQNGGAVLVAAGPDYAGNASIYHSGLSNLLPAIPTGNVTTIPYRAKMTIKGKRHPVVRGLKGGGGKKPTWGKWFRLIDSKNDGGSVLLTGPEEKPLLLVSRKGKGRVAQLMSDHSWLWDRGYDGGGPQAELLRRIAHWLMAEPDLEEEKLSGRQKGKTLIITRQTMSDKAGKITITTPSGKTKTLEFIQQKPGLWTAQTAITEPGIHKLINGDKTAFAAVGSPDPRESSQVHSTEKPMKDFVSSTKGSITRIAKATPRVVMVKSDRSFAGSGWIGLKRNNAYDVTAIKTLPLMTSLLALLALLGLITAMWYREGR